MARSYLLDDLIPLPLTTEVTLVPPDPSCLQPLQWFISQGLAGIPLTQMGNLGRAFVRKADELYSWYPGSAFGWKPQRDYDLAPLVPLRQLITRMGAVRRKGRQLWITSAGKSMLAGDEKKLWTSITKNLATGKDFHADLMETLLAILLQLHPSSISHNACGLRVGEIMEQSWNIERFVSPTMEHYPDLGPDLMSTVSLLTVLGICTENRAFRAEDWLRLTPIGQEAAIVALQSRAAAWSAKHPDRVASLQQTNFSLGTILLFPDRNVSAGPSKVSMPSVVVDPYLKHLAEVELSNEPPVPESLIELKDRFVELQRKRLSATRAVAYHESLNGLVDYADEVLRKEPLDRKYVVCEDKDQDLCISEIYGPGAVLPFLQDFFEPFAFESLPRSALDVSPTAIKRFVSWLGERGYVKTEAVSLAHDACRVAAQRITAVRTAEKLLFQTSMKARMSHFGRPQRASLEGWFSISSVESNTVLLRRRRNGVTREFGPMPGPGSALHGLDTFLLHARLARYDDGWCLWTVDGLYPISRRT